RRGQDPRDAEGRDPARDAAEGGVREAAEDQGRAGVAQHLPRRNILMATTSEREGQIHVRRGDGAAAGAAPAATARPEAGGGAAAPGKAALPQRAPAVDIFEREDGLVLLADLPGVPPDAVTLDVNRD